MFSHARLVLKLKRAQTLDPENPKWLQDLGHMYLRGAMFGWFKGFELAGDPDVPSGLAELVVPTPTEGSEGSALVAMELAEWTALIKDGQTPDWVY